jgi:hypothetical protein
MIRNKALIAAASLLLCAPLAIGQAPGGGRAPQTAKAAARNDLTGYWVAYVTEDWRFRMITPPKGDYSGVPLNVEGRKTAMAWDPAAVEKGGDACRYYGAPAIMRIPGRIHITWQDDNTLKVETDAGMQTRLFNFSSKQAAQGPSGWQGRSIAQWEKPESIGRVGFETPPQGGGLKVVTTNLQAGYLRRNGVPYSENAVLTEYFDVGTLPGVGTVLVVTSIVDDPKYLTQLFQINTHFKKEADGSKWDPMPCSVNW